jgi:hypothetical protein
VGVADAGSWVAVGRGGASTGWTVAVAFARGVAVTVGRGGVAVAVIVRVGVAVAVIVRVGCGVGGSELL